MAHEPDVPEVRPPTLDDVRRICHALHDARARYLLIGGFAVILHGGQRTTKDIDLLVNPAPDNVARLKSALSILEGGPGGTRSRRRSGGPLPYNQGSSPPPGGPDHPRRVGRSTWLTGARLSGEALRLLNRLDGSRLEATS